MTLMDQIREMQLEAQVDPSVTTVETLFKLEAQMDELVEKFREACRKHDMSAWASDDFRSYERAKETQARMYDAARELVAAGADPDMLVEVHNDVVREKFTEYGASFHLWDRPPAL